MGVHISHRREQHPVGQGGFHSAVVETEGGSIRYVYDCGAMQAGARSVIEARALGAHLDAREARLDAVVISHFDADHVNGLRTLIGTKAPTRARKLYLPALDEVQRVFILARWLSTGAGRSEILRSYVVTGAAGLAATLGMNAEDVIEVAATPSSDGVASPDPDQPPHDQSDDQPLRIVHGAGPSGTRQAAHVAGQPGTQADDQPLVLRQGTTPVWEFVFYVDKWSPKDRDTFLKALAGRPPIAKASGATGSGPAAAAAVETWLQSQQNREALLAPPLRKEVRKAYESVRGNVNLTSMMLYSGPVGEARVCGRGRWCCAGGGCWYDRPFPAAWLGTGDAKINDDDDRVERLVRHFTPARLARVGTFMVPHHGSAYDFGDKMARKVAQAVPVFPYGTRNTYGHPTATARIQAARMRGPARDVTEQTASRFVEHLEIDLI